MEELEEVDLCLSSPSESIEVFNPPSTLPSVKNIQIAVCVLGDWKTTKIPLEYLILLLNSKQTLFEYQLIQLDDHVKDLKNVFGKGSSQYKLILDMMKGSTISCGKLDMKHHINDIATALRREIDRKTDIFDKSGNPEFFIFITTSKHTDINFFQDDGSNGFTKTEPCRGAIIMTGHHESRFAPPTVIEFIYKFIFRISVKWYVPSFTRNQRHYGQKSCLFDFNHDISYVRYLVLHNYICSSCRAKLGEDVSRQIIKALDSETLYGCKIERHPAKISSELGFNLSLVKGIYKTKIENVREKITESFYSRIGSLFAVSFAFFMVYATGIESWFINED